MWHTKPIKRLGLKPFTMYDGPHGVRADMNGEIKSTYFPSAICRAATWNPELSHEFGRPTKELKRFEKVSLRPNETKTVIFELKKEDLSFYDEAVNSWVVETGAFNILVGSSSRDIRLQGEIEYLE